MQVYQVATKPLHQMPNPGTLGFKAIGQDLGREGMMNTTTYIAQRCTKEEDVVPAV